jgi:nucleotide-binding universal stress UspA family protein
VIAIDRIVCAVDFSDHSKHALEYAVAMGTYYGAHVTALHVYSAAPIVTTAPFGLEAMQVVNLQQVDREAVDAAARRFVAQVPSPAAIDVRTVEGLKVADEVTVQTDLLNADLLVIGSHGRSGFERFLLGSTADRVLRKVRAPVLVVPPHAAGHPGPQGLPFKRILCPIDFSDSSVRALGFALHLAEEGDAHLTILHAIEVPPELHEALPMDVDIRGVRVAAADACKTRLDALVPEEARTYCTIETRVVEGKAHHEILQAAADLDADLIVMGVQGRGAVDVAVFGSNTQSVARGAVCPVLTVRS